MSLATCKWPLLPGHFYIACRAHERRRRPACAKNDAQEHIHQRPPWDICTADMTTNNIGETSAPCCALLPQTAGVQTCCQHQVNLAPIHVHRSRRHACRK